MSRKFEAQRLSIPEVILVSPAKFEDERGFFSETFNAAALRDVGIDAAFVQDNQSLSRPKGVVRGLHFQKPPHAQGKLVRVTRGRILDVAVDVRNGSPTFGQYVSVELSADNWKQLWVPEGFAHAFCTLEPDTEVFYKVTDYYAPECDAGILWNDAQLAISWPIRPEDAVLSDKDSRLPCFADIPAYFTYES